VRLSIGTLTLALTAALLLALAGCSSKAEHSYRRAQSLDHAGKHQLALDEYLRVANESPGHPLADDALYHAAFIYREYLEEPQRAAQTYERLVNEYPDGDFYENALLWLGALYTEEGKMRDPDRAISYYRQILDRRNGRAPMKAEALLAIARILLEKKDKRAIERCKELIAKYPDDRYHKREAQLLLAEAMESLGAKPEEVIKAYQKVVDEFPNTRTADKAKRAIGWISYRVRQAEEAKPKESTKVSHAVLKGVPAYGAFAARGWVHAEMIDALTAAAKAAGRDVSAPLVAGITGGVFQFFYTSEDPTLGAGILAENPPQLVADALGLSRNQMSSDTLEHGLARLRQCIDEGHPVLAPYGGPGRWTLVVGYDTDKKLVYVLTAGATKPRPVPEAEFGKRWQAGFERPSGLPESVPTPAPFYQFSFGPSLHKPSINDIIGEALRRGAKWLLEPAAFGIPSGLAAYKELMEHLRRCGTASEPDPEGDARLAAWGKAPLTSLLSSRKCAAEFLRLAAEKSSGIREANALAAARKYDEIVNLLENLRVTFPQLPEETEQGSAIAEDAMNTFRDKCLDAQTIVQQIADREREAAGLLERAAQ